ncbi:MAG: protein-methionine-sulfoxide reductase catalytic subunit MsrP [Gammaproteobacteria bacterium]|nr:protein-methionine-sulfoxide reductase catalytic subunit MsrP [Gammaproteobacteria bacterium]
MTIKRPAEIRTCDITDRDFFENRRAFLYGGAALALGMLGPGVSQARPRSPTAPRLPPYTKTNSYDPVEALTPYAEITTHTNFYEFSGNKRRASRLAKRLRTRPWTVSVEGEVRRPKTFDIDELIGRFPLEERIYRLRCVEAWSMVVPWIGFPLARLIKSVEPTSRAKFVAFETLHDPKQMPGQNPRWLGSSLDWPYAEGLRIDEAVHPLTILAVGLYGETIPNQNGAPIRLVVPWKYGFKSIKSIVRVRLVEEQPVTSWPSQATREYGFYANVNPDVNHPRWSQAHERRIGTPGKRPTLLFNGYHEQVADLYRGMDLRKNF